MVAPWHRMQFEALLGRRDRLPHGLLIRGPEGIGKLGFARMLAQALLCEHPASGGVPCGACSGCNWFLQGSHPDFRLLEPEQPKENADAGEGREKKASVQIAVEQGTGLAALI